MFERYICQVDVIAVNVQHMFASTDAHYQKNCLRQIQILQNNPIMKLDHKKAFSNLKLDHQQNREEMDENGKVGCNYSSEDLEHYLTGF